MKKRNPIARVVKSIRPQVVRDKRRESMDKVTRQEIEERVTHRPDCDTVMWGCGRVCDCGVYQKFREDRDDDA